MRWSSTIGCTSTEGCDSQPVTINNGILYVMEKGSSDNGTVLAFDVSSGKTLWQQPVTLSSAAAAQVYNGVLYYKAVASTQGEQDMLEAFNLSDGKPLWTHDDPHTTPLNNFDGASFTIAS